MQQRILSQAPDRLQLVLNQDLNVDSLTLPARHELTRRENVPENYRSTGQRPVEETGTGRFGISAHRGFLQTCFSSAFTSTSWL